jgi:hypothetical protein
VRTSSLQLRTARREETDIERTTVMRKMLRSVLAVVAIVLAVSAFERVSVAAQNSPVAVDDTSTFAPGELCDFGLEITLSGKGKTIELPGGRFIFTSPGLQATLTNLSVPSKQVTLNITGAFHQTTTPEGNVVTVSTGRSLLGDPVAGFVLAIGRFSFVFNAANELVQPLQGRGQLIDACTLVS